MSGQSRSAILERERRVSRALYWLARHEADEPLSIGELRDWELWLAEPSNRAEFDTLMSTLCDLRCLPCPDLPATHELRSSRVSDRAADRLRILCSRVTARVRGLLSAGFRPSLAAAILATVSVVMAMLIPLEWPLAWRSSELNHAYTTMRGEHREFPLPDKTVVTLAGDSHLTVAFTPTQRIAVLDHGEGRFHVQHDPLRPFTVLAGRGSITAVGTVFDVRRYSDRVLVTVSEGVVEVAPGTPAFADAYAGQATVVDASGRIPLRVARGEEMAYDVRGKASAARHVDTRIAESWIQGSLAYRGRPLREVIEDVQRYCARRIVLDPAIADLEYTGTFVERRLDQWLRGLGQIFPVEVVEDGADRILIRSLPQSDSDSVPEH